MNTTHHRQPFSAMTRVVALSLVLWQQGSLAQTGRVPKAQPEAQTHQKPASSERVGVLIGDIKDSRTTGSFFAGMEIELKVVGDALADARAMRVSVDAAVDDTGRNLIGEKAEKPEFKEVDLSGKNAATARVDLKNPVRQATAIQELAGSIELFIPRRDADSIITLNYTPTNVGNPVQAPGLKAAGIELVIWNKDQFDARSKEEEEKLRKEMAARQKKEGNVDAQEDIGEALAGGLQKLFGGLFSSFGRMEENSLAFQMTDPHSRVVNIEFENEKGKPLARGGTMTMGGGQTKTTIYEFKQKLPDGARIKVQLLTPKATIKVPFRLTGIPLP